MVGIDIGPGISMAASISLPRSNRHDHKRSCIPVSCRITCVRITIVYFVFIYGEIQSYTERKTIVYDPSIRNSHVVSISDRIFPSTIVFLRIRSRRYTIVIRAQVILQNTVVYDCERIVDAHLRLYTETVILDLGCFIFYLSLFVKSYIT